jgi:hypothetical protein
VATVATERSTEPIEQQAETPAPTRPRPRRRPSLGSVIWGSVGLFAVLFSMLTYQLSSAMQATPTATAPRPVLMRRVVKRRIVTRVVPAQAAAGTRWAPMCAC